MLNSLLALINQEGSLDLGEACLYALIGFAIVFVGIVIIILIIWLIGLVLRKTNNLNFHTVRGKKEKAIEQPLPEHVEKVDNDIPDEVKAAIVAAIMAYYTEEKPQCEFRVRRIKRI